MVNKESPRKHIVHGIFFPLILIALFGLTACETKVLNQPPDRSNSYPSDPGFPQSMAEDFVLNSTVNITRLTIWGVYAGTGIPTPVTDNFTVIIHRNSANLPDTPISTQNNVPFFSLATGSTVNGSPEYVFFLTLATPVTLTPGRYWVEIYNDTAADSENIFAWETGTLDPVNGISNCAYSSIVPGDNWAAPAAGPIDLAIEIWATRGTVQAVPTMSGWGIMIFAVLSGSGVVYFIRKQKRAKS